MGRLGKFMIIMLFGALLLGGCAKREPVQTTANEQAKAGETQVQQSDKEKKGLLVVSFGTSYADTRKATIEAVEQKVAAALPDYEFRRAFTSDIIIKKLKERDNILIDTVEEALEKMKNDGFTDVLLLPTHIIPGEEYDDVLEIYEKYKASFKSIKITTPILYTQEDYMAAITALKQQIPNLNKDQAVIFMGHGTPHPANACYSQLQYVLWEEGMKNVFVGTVEGFPTLDNIIPKLRENGIKEVTLMPYMLVAGDHANNDMSGDEDDSWKTILKKEGFIVNTYIHGLGENSGYQDIYIKHAKAALDKE